jgi:hypothetical protein
MSAAATFSRARRGRSARAAVSQAPRRWMVMAFCPLTGPWRQLVQAESAAGAIVKYCAEHDLAPDQCQAVPD